MSENNSNNNSERNNRTAHTGRGGRGGRGRSSYGRGRSYSGRGRGSYKNNTYQNKIKNDMKGECTELGKNVYYIGDARQSDNYTKVTEVIMNYIKKEYKKGMDIVNAIEEEKHHVYFMPASKKDRQGNPIPVDTTTIEGLIVKSQVTQYMQDVKQYDIEKVNAHALFHGQCHKSVKDKLEQGKRFKNMF